VPAKNIVFAVAKNSLLATAKH